MNTRVLNSDQTLSGDLPEESANGDFTSSAGGVNDDLQSQPVVEFDTPHGVVRVFCDGSSPDTSVFYLVCDKLKKILSLENGWDSYDAKPVRREAIEDTLNLLSELRVFEGVVPVPQIFATPDGSIQLEWISSARDIELLRTGRNAWELYVDDLEREEEVEESISYDLSPLISVLNR